VSFDQNQDIKGEKKPSTPTDEKAPKTSSNYEEFGTSGGDTLLEMPAIDPELVRPDKLAEGVLSVAQPLGTMNSQPTLAVPKSETPVSSEALAWLNGEEDPPAPAQDVAETLALPRLSMGDDSSNQPQEEIKAESTLLAEPPQEQEEPKPEAPISEAIEATPEAKPEVEAPPVEAKPEVPEPKPSEGEDSIELVEEFKTDSEEGEDNLSEQIGWSKGLPEKQETQAPPAPKMPPPTPKAPPPPLPSGPQKAVSNPNAPRADASKKSKLDLPPELFEDVAPSKPAEAAIINPTPTLQMPKILAKGWWDTIFNEDFLRTNPAKSEAMTRKEADFIEQSLVPKPGDSILDVACGYGRHVIEMATRNYNMVGLDLSLPYLMLAAEISTRRKLMANFIHGDMRDLQFKEYFDHAYCVFTSFGYFDDDANLESLRGIHRSLKTKGRFLLEVINRDFAVSACPLRGWWEGIGCVMLEETEFNYNSSVLSTKRSIIFEDGRQAMQETHVRLYSLHELTALYKACGFKILEVSGGVDLRGVFFGADSTHTVILAEKQR
jgi:SAM-dependent methyltransferase